MRVSGFQGARLSRAARQGDFAKLMELYETNYLLLRVLAPCLDELGLGETYRSSVPNCMPLYLSVLERCPYTTTLHLSYQFDGSTRERREPDLTLRLYRDARTAEVLSGLIHGERHIERKTRSLNNSWQINRFLYKWLRYCNFRGHKFSEGRTVQVSL